MLRVALPWPPTTANKMYVTAVRWANPKADASGNVTRKRYLGRRLNDSIVGWKNDVVTLVRQARHEGGTVPDGPLHIEVEVFPPDRRKRDLDNLLKALLDSTKLAIGVDDDMERVPKISIVNRGAKFPCPKGGGMFVTVREFVDD